MHTPLYDEEMTNEIGKKIEDVIKRMYNEYKSADEEEDRATNEIQKLDDLMEKKNDDGSRVACNYYKFVEHLIKKDSQECKTKFDKNIKEPCEKSKTLKVSVYLVDSQFDILSWWKSNSGKYTILAEMAKDIFSIPISTVVSEFFFNTRGRF